MRRIAVALCAITLLVSGCAGTLGKATPDQCTGLCIAVGNAKAGGSEGGELSTSFVEVAESLFCTVRGGLSAYLRLPVEPCAGELEEELPE